ncbi:MAG: bifunctional metallophosphatase/5'-nucleotidase [Myxococcota bacterium]
MATSTQHIILKALACCAVAIIASGCSSVPKTAHATSRPTTQPQQVELTILHVNDVYEIFPLQSGTVGGMARLATLAKQLRAENPNTYLLLSGDFVAPSAISNAVLDGRHVYGEQMVDLMNRVGVDWAIFGNHEFDIPPAALQSRIHEAQFGWMAGNVRRKDGDNIVPFFRHGKPLPDYTVWQIRGAGGQMLRLGVIAASIESNKKPFVHYKNLLQTAQASYQALINNEKVDAVIAMTHLPIAQDRQIAKHLPDLALIVGGHEHRHHFEKVGTVAIANASADARNAFVHRLRWNGKALSVTSELVWLNEKIAPDTEISKRVKWWMDRVKSYFQKQGIDLLSPLVVLKQPLDGLEADIRTRQTSLGRALTQAMYQAAQPHIDLALANSGMVRLDDILQGPINQFDIVRILPFGGSLVKVKMQGTLVQKILDAGEKSRNEGSYLQRYPAQQLQGKWQIGNQWLEPQKMYWVVMPNYLMTGLEVNMEFLTPRNPQVHAVIKPTDKKSLRDIRLAFVKYLQTQATQKRDNRNL